MGLGGLGTKGLGTGLDNIRPKKIKTSLLKELLHETISMSVKSKTDA